MEPESEKVREVREAVEKARAASSPDLEVIVVPVFLGWDLTKLYGKASVREDGQIIIQVGPSSLVKEEIRHLLRVAQNGSLKAISLTYQWDANNEKKG